MLKRKRIAAQKRAVAADAAELDGSIRPVVRLPQSGMSVGAVAAIAGIGALVLFSVLESRRHIPAQASIWAADAATGPAVSGPPPLRLPIAPTEAIIPVSMVVSDPAVSDPPPPPSPDTVRAYYARGNQPPPPPIYYPPPAQPAPAVAMSQPHGSTASPLVIDTTTPNNAASGTGTNAAPQTSGTTGPARTRSSMLANRTMTVPQGTLIPAVLETAFDSTRPGFARAIVSRDVRGFDGSKILVPRGSSLIGEYRSDAAPGQKRATIMWTRLLRPDGVTIELDSPAVDPVGRGGVKASVNNHIPARVFETLLQSSFAVGTMLATRAATGSVVVALPTSLQGSVGPQTTTTQIAPTLKVPAGTSISIFVARDLEFGGAG